jgi:hypothetical protein
MDQMTWKNYYVNRMLDKGKTQKYQLNQQDIFLDARVCHIQFAFFSCIFIKSTK